MRVSLKCAILLMSFASAPLWADIPVPRLDGTHGKGAEYKTPFPYDPLDQESRFGLVKTTLKASDGEYARAKEQAFAETADVSKARREALKAQFCKEVVEEFDLTPEEKQVAEKNQFFFGQEAKTGKRWDRHQVFEIGNKKLDGTGWYPEIQDDLDGDGQLELILSYHPPVTHAYTPEIHIWSHEGKSITSVETNYAGIAVADLDGDGRKELLVRKGNAEDGDIDVYRLDPKLAGSQDDRHRRPVLRPR